MEGKQDRRDEPSLGTHSEARQDTLRPLALAPQLQEGGAASLVGERDLSFPSVASAHASPSPTAHHSPLEASLLEVREFPRMAGLSSIRCHLPPEGTLNQLQQAVEGLLGLGTCPDVALPHPLLGNSFDCRPSQAHCSGAVISTRSLGGGDQGEPSLDNDVQPTLLKRAANLGNEGLIH